MKGELSLELDGHHIPVAVHECREPAARADQRQRERQDARARVSEVIKERHERAELVGLAADDPDLLAQGHEHRIQLPARFTDPLVQPELVGDTGIVVDVEEPACTPAHPHPHTAPRAPRRIMKTTECADLASTQTGAPRRSQKGGTPIRMLGIVGGTGLYDLEGLTDKTWKRIDSPFGAPSDELLFGNLDGQPVVFLPRHGRGHRIPPHEINFRANIDVLKRAGVTAVMSVSAVGSLRAELTPGTFVVVDQFVDRTLRGPKTFFGTGLVAHVSMAHPTCRRMGREIAAAAEELGLAFQAGGTYLVMEGPQFSSLAESRMHIGLSCDVVGMTNMPEAKLAREAELCYATVAMVTDFDCWHPEHEHVQVSDVVKVLHANSANAKRLVAHVIPRVAKQDGACPFGCDHALDAAVLTAPEARDPEMVAKLRAIAGRVLGR